MKNKHFWIALALLGAVSGCTNVAGGSGNDSDLNDPVPPPVEEPKPECSEGSDCDSGICVDGTCAKTVGKGASCDALHLCKDGLTCVVGTCQPIEPEEECNNSGKNCPDGQVCVDHECKDLVILGKGDACTIGDIENVCADPMICYEGKCQKNPADFDCTVDEDCDHQEIFNTCVEGQCSAVGDLGAQCDDERYLCAEGQTCIGFCVNIAAEKESCDLANHIYCDFYNSFECIEGVCEFVTDRQIQGGDCDDLKKCGNDLVCLNGKCMAPGKEGDACDEDEFTTCANGMMCVLGQCIPVSGTCQKSEECLEKDSYCCQSETCGAIGYCIPYDENTTHDEMCLFKTKPGIFEAQIQCRWQPPANAYPNSSKVEMMPLVGKFGNKAGLATTVAFYSYYSENGPGNTVIRIINPETCETLESIVLRLEDRWHNFPAAADLDKDGLMEIIVRLYDSSVPAAYKWNPETQKHEQMWKGDKAGYGYNMMVHDIDNDGNPEVIAGSAVYNGQTGKLISGTLFPSATGSDYGASSGIGNFDLNDEGVAWLHVGGKIYKWNLTNKAWELKHTFFSASHYQNYNTAYADFGTPGATAADFDYKTLDGKPEFVVAGNNKLYLFALISDGAAYKHQTLMDVRGFSIGGPVTIGDFNNDGLPEIALASQAVFGVYDPKCTTYEAGKCADKHVLWERWSQDASSGRTGSSLFDFDGDGQTEAVYADECYLRVYDGKTGRILFSAPRSSYTSIEGPVIADIDDDGSSEILMGSDYNYACYNDGSSSKVNSGVDPIHEGIRCMDDEDCPTSKNCDKTLGLCLCETDADCNTQYIDGKIFKQYTCTSPIHENVGFMHNPTGATTRSMIKNRGVRPDGWSSSTGYKVCRAWRDVRSTSRQAGVADLMIFKDRLDRWVSSRNLWNQHAYNIININDDGTVPTAKVWKDNWLLKKVGEFITGSTTQERPVYNNYRMNEQGLYGAGTVPDITGRFVLGNICGETEDGRKVISGKLCNRGTKPVATNLPATFFYYDENAPEGRGEKICTSYTPGIVGVGECQHVGCTVEEAVFEALQDKKVLMVTNLNEYDQSATVECNYNNNTDTITIDKCEAEIEIVN